MADTYQTKLTVNGRNPGDNTLEVYRTAGTECTELAATYRNQHFWLPTGKNWFTRKWISGEDQDDGFKQCVCVNAGVPTTLVACDIASDLSASVSWPDNVTTVLTGFNGRFWDDYGGTYSERAFFLKYTVVDDIGTANVDINGTHSTANSENDRCPHVGESIVDHQCSHGTIISCNPYTFCKFVSDQVYFLAVVRITHNLFYEETGSGIEYTWCSRVIAGYDVNLVSQEYGRLVAEYTSDPLVVAAGGDRLQELNSWLLEPKTLNKCYEITPSGTTEDLVIPSSIRVFPS